MEYSCPQLHCQGRSTVVCGYLVVVDGLWWNTFVCGYPAVVVGYQVVDDEPLRRWNTVVCYLVVDDEPLRRWSTVVCGYPVVNNGLGQGRSVKMSI